MESCPSNTTILDIATENEESTSFEDILFSSILAIAILIPLFGTVKVLCFNKDCSKIKEIKQDERSKDQDSSWKSRMKKLKRIFALIWPKESDLQLRILVCFLLMICERILKNILPIYKKKIMEGLTEQEFCWDLILISIGIQIVEGYSGLFLLRRFIWNNVSYNTKARMEITLFKHLHNLSLRWHLSKKTGEVLRVMDRGVSAIGRLLQHLLFQLLPILIDIPIAVICIMTHFSIFFGLVIFAIMILLFASRYLGML